MNKEQLNHYYELRRGVIKGSKEAFGLFVRLSIKGLYQDIMVLIWRVQAVFRG